MYHFQAVQKEASEPASCIQIHKRLPHCAALVSFTDSKNIVLFMRLYIIISAANNFMFKKPVLSFIKWLQKDDNDMYWPDFMSVHALIQK